MEKEREYLPPTEIAMPPLPEEPVVEAEAPEEAPAVEMKEEAPVEQPKAPEPTNDEIANAKAKNFKALKEKADRAERERDQLMRRLQEYEQARNNSNPAHHPVAEDSDLSIGADDLAEGKHLVKLNSKIKQMEQKLAQYEQYSSMSNAELRVKTEMPDYEKVVSEENIELLKTMAPELAESVAANPDLYSKAKAAYKLIKKFGIHVEDTFEKDRAIVAKNAAKPRPLTSLSPQQGDTPLSKANAFANGLTPELAAQLRREMEEATRNF